MSAYLAYSYSTRCGKEEETLMNERVEKSRIDFKINIFLN